MQRKTSEDLLEARVAELLANSAGPEELLACQVDDEPIFKAVLNHSNELLQALLQHGPSPNHPGAGFPLHSAVRQRQRGSMPSRCR